MRIQKNTALLIMLVFVLSLLVFLFKVKDEMHDFEVNYIAGKRLRWAETLYRYDDGHYMFKYLPSSAFLYLPFAYLSLNTAKALWYGVILTAFVFMVHFSYSMLSEGRKTEHLLILTPLILLKFYLRELSLGQINAIMTVVLLLMIRNLLPDEKKSPTKREIVAGCLWGLGIAMKPYAAIFLPYFVYKKKWRTLLCGLVFLGGAILSPAIFYGIEGNFIVLKEWYSTLSKTTPGLLTTADNVSIIALFAKWTGNPNQSLLLSIGIISVLALLFLILILKGRGMPQAPVLECGLGLLLIPLVSPLGWDYTLLMSTLAVMMIIQKFQLYSTFWRIILIINLTLIFSVTYDLLGRELYTTIMHWCVTTFNFLILAGYLAFLRFKKIY